MVCEGEAVRERSQNAHMHHLELRQVCVFQKRQKGLEPWGLGGVHGKMVKVVVEIVLVEGLQFTGGGRIERDAPGLRIDSQARHAVHIASVGQAEVGDARCLWKAIEHDPAGFVRIAERNAAECRCHASGLKGVRKPVCVHACPTLKKGVGGLGALGRPGYGVGS